MFLCAKPIVEGKHPYLGRQLRHGYQKQKLLLPSKCDKFLHDIIYTICSQGILNLKPTSNVDNKSYTQKGKKMTGGREKDVGQGDGENQHACMHKFCSCSTMISLAALFSLRASKTAESGRHLQQCLLPASFMETAQCFQTERQGNQCVTQISVQMIFFPQAVS